jgi:dipeptidyl aminopeptidase/acylaminoacyl peptidase
MRDVKDLLQPLDRLSPPELWRDASDRRLRRLSDPEPRGNRLAVAVVAGIVAVASAAFVVRASDRPGPSSGGNPSGVRNGRLAFVREPCSPPCMLASYIVVASANGTGQREVASGATPEWSPDGSALAFTGENEIDIARADGTHVAPIVRCAGPTCVSVSSPTWSPNGRQIAFEGQYHSGTSPKELHVDIWIANADGSSPHAVTSCRRPECVSNFAPSWSPQGDQIAMWSMVRCGDHWGPSLRILDLPGGSVRSLVSCTSSEGARIAWSPSGHQLAYEANTANKTANIFTISPMRGPRTQVTSCDGTQCRWAFYPSWSPDGQWLLFATKAEVSAGFELGRVRLIDGTFEPLGIAGFWPSWQPIPAGA